VKFVRIVDPDQRQIKTAVVTPVGLKDISGDMFGEWEFTGNVFSEEEVTFEAPLNPNQIIGIGANYVRGPKDLPETLPDLPVFFFKPVSSVIGPDASIVIPNGIEEVKFESELAVVIGKEMKDVPEADVSKYIFGYTVGNDVTAPQYFHEDGHWTVGKSFDTFTPLGPVIETDLNPDKICVESYLNETKKQDSSTRLMIISIHKMISYLSGVMTLSPGDVILTGSPVGAEFLKESDTIECKINEIGALRNTVMTLEKV
jgi:2-keto-4-pentenoate hydratase/2-oxohepta-3-ene-1,7-dioic acid hydratase in catechol pathway